MDVAFVIPVFNQLNYTVECLLSLNRAGVPDREIVVVDNASTDGTREFLAGRSGLRVITNATNAGCSGAWNQGAQASTAQWTVIVNNDVIVAPGLREGLVSFAEETRHDVVSPAMGEGEMDYEIEPFARDFVLRMRNVWRQDTASGVCFMVHRRVFDQVGFFDTKVGLAGNEDEDFFRRCRAAGYGLAITGRGYLHHFVSVTQKSVKANMGLPNSARLSDREYMFRKYQQTWLRRRIERVQEKSQAALWRWRERWQFGLTLKMKRHAGQWHFA